MAGKKKGKSDLVGQNKQKPTGLDIARQSIEKKYGKVVFSLIDHADLQIPTVSSGSLGLDLALGRGGFALGRIYEIFGPPSGGKTSLAISTIIEAQKRGMTPIIIDAEHAIDPSLVKKMGANIEDIKIIQAYSGEDNLDAAETYMKTGEIDLLVIDSVSALIPKAETEAEVGNEFIALLARLMSKALRRFVPIANETNTLMLFINQIRYKIGAFGNPEDSTGGEALNFYATGRISVRGAEYKSNRIIDPISGSSIGHKCKIEVVKNKLAPPFQQATLPLIYGKGFDLHWEVLTLATDLGIIDKNGAWYSYKDENLAQGEFNMMALLKEKSDLYNELRNTIIERTGLKEHYERNK